MAVDKYEPSYDFSDDLGTTHGLHLDIEFANLSTTTGELSDALNQIQRSDGKIRDSAVDVHTLSRDVMNLIGGFRTRGGWATATAYAVNDVVDVAGYVYVSKVAHTSSALFSSDSANWIQFGFGPSTLAQATADAAQAAITAHLAAATGAHDASEIAYAGGPSLPVSSVEAAIDALDTTKAPLASPAFTGTPTAPTAAPGSAGSQVANAAFVSAAVAAVASGGATLSSLGAILNSSVVKSTSDNVGTSHKGKVFRCTATLTLALTAAATLGDGFAFGVFPEGGAVVTLDPAGSETIDGATAKNFTKPAIVYCDGLKFTSIGLMEASAYVASVNGNTGAISAAQIAAAATTGYGYTPANSSHSHSYADLTAFVSASWINAGSGFYRIRFTRANGSTFDVVTSVPDGSGGGS